MTPAIPFLELRTQYLRMKPEIDRAIQDVMDSGIFLLGPQLEAFEEEFAKWLGAGRAVGVASGTDALRLALLAAGIGPGDEVVTTALTAVATVVAIEATGARAVLADIDDDTYTLDPAAAEAQCTARTRAIVPVHLYGQMADVEALSALAARRGLTLVEDACQAHGAAYRGRAAGTIGAYGVFSFYPTKNVGAYGDAGIVVTDRDERSVRVRGLRNYGEGRRFEHLSRGFNSRLDEIQAAVLRAKLRRLPEWNARRRALAALYSERFAGSGVVTPVERPERTHVYCSYVIRHSARDRLRQWLTGHGIGTSVQYPSPVHLQPAYRDLGGGPGCFPRAERAAREILSLPIFPELDDADAHRVADAVLDFRP